MADDALGPCGWCERPAVTHVITVPGRKNRKTTPVCETHAQDFENRGVMTTRLEVERREESTRKRASWKARQKWHH